MKQIKITILLLGLISLAGFTHAQTADQVIANYFKNVGGEQNWNNLQTITMQIKMTVNGMEMTGTIYSKRPDKQKSEVIIMGKTVINAYDGKDAWMQNPFLGDSTPQLVPASMAQSMKRNSFEPEFLNYAEKGNSVELVGSDTVNGKNSYEIKLTKKNGEVEYNYFDQETYYLIKTKGFPGSDPQQTTESDIYFSDFRKVGGMIFPFKLETHIGAQGIQDIYISDIEVNKPMEDSIFAFPAK